MAVQYAPMKLRVPAGFQNLLEGLAREVLREQPDDIIVFAAQYFKNQLLIREETGQDDAKKGDKMEKLMKEEEEVDIDLNDPDVKAAATKIQASFRGHKSRETVKKHKDEEEAAVKIQASFRGFQAREKVKEIKESQSSQEVADRTEEAVIEVTAPEAQPDEADAVNDKQEPVEAAPAVQPDEAEGFTLEVVGKSPKVANSAEAADGASEKQEPAEVVPDDAQPEAPEAEAVSKSPEAAEEAGIPEAAAESAEGADKQEAEADIPEAAAESAEGADKQEAVDEAPDAQPDVVVASETPEVHVEAGETKGAEEIDIDTNDPEVRGAALKIQASFRGFKAREEVKAMKSGMIEPQNDDQASSEKAADDQQESPENAEEGKDDDAEESASIPQDNEATEEKTTDETQELPEGTEEGKSDDVKESED